MDTTLMRDDTPPRTSSPGGRREMSQLLSRLGAERRLLAMETYAERNGFCRLALGDGRHLTVSARLGGGFHYRLSRGAIHDGTYEERYVSPAEAATVLHSHPEAI